MIIASWSLKHTIVITSQCNGIGHDNSLIENNLFHHEFLEENKNVDIFDFIQ